MQANMGNKIKKTKGLPDAPDLDYEDLEEDIEQLWEFLESRKYHLVCDKCKQILLMIEKDLADDFGQDRQTTTLYEDPNKLRRKRFLEVLKLYQRALHSLVIELVITTDDTTDIDPNFKQYQALHDEIQAEMYKVAYLFGAQYQSHIFITSSDLAKLDKLFREHCQFILKNEFFTRFKLVILALGSLDRKNFHKVTDTYKNLRKVCEQCLQILDVMKDGRFFGANDTFIEDYEKDVNIYLQILWYLAIKTDLNKTDKFLNPNTYSEGLDKHCQVFAALTLIDEVVPHLEEARNVGLRDNAMTELVEEYVEYLYKIITHEEGQIGKNGLQLLQETDRLLAAGYPNDYDKGFELSLPADAGDDLEGSYGSLDELKHTYSAMIRNKPEVYLQQDDSQEFAELLEQAARGVGVKETALEGQEGQERPEKIRTVYRYEYQRGLRTPEPAVFVIKSGLEQPRALRFLHKEWVAELYAAWKDIKRLKYLKGIIERHTKRQEKTKYRIDFAIKLRKGFFVLRLGRHKRVAVPNPEGRVLRHDTSVDQVLASLREPIFFVFLKELKVQYVSRHGLKLQALRWSWFAERELKEGYFEKPKYNYLKYINTRWKEKVKERYQLLQKLARRDDDEDEDEDEGFKNL